MEITPAVRTRSIDNTKERTRGSKMRINLIKREENLIKCGKVIEVPEYGLVNLTYNKYSPGGFSHKIITGGEDQDFVFKITTKYLLKFTKQKKYQRVTRPYKFIFYECTDRSFRDVSYNIIKNNAITHVDITITGYSITITMSDDCKNFKKSKKFYNFTLRKLKLIREYMEYCTVLENMSYNDLKLEHCNVFNKNNRYFVAKKRRVKNKLIYNKLNILINSID